MSYRYDDGPQSSDRSGDVRRTASADPVYARRIDCAEAPGSRERSGAGQGRGAPEPEPYAARPLGSDTR